MVAIRYLKRSPKGRWPEGVKMERSGAYLAIDMLWRSIGSLLKNLATSAKIRKLLFRDARTRGAQRISVVLCLDRGADPGKSSAAADPEAGESGFRTAQSQPL